MASSKKRSRFTLIPGQHRPKYVRNGAIVLVVLGILVYSGYSRHLLFTPRGGTVVRAEFLDATNVQGSTVVRIHGVNIGKVDGVKSVGEGAARREVVSMRVDSDKADLLRSDARADIYWRTLLGRNVYVELTPGTSKSALGDQEIPASRTSAQVELDQALEPLDASGRAGFRTFLSTTSSALENAQPPRKALETVGPAMRAAAAGLPPLSGEHRGDLTKAVQGTRDVVTALDQSEEDLGNLIDSADMTLGVTAARRADIASTLQIAPGALATTRAEMGRIRSTLDRLDPVVDGLRPGARVLDDAAATLTPALRDTQPALDALRPVLGNLRPAVTSLRTAAVSGVPLIRRLKPTIARTNGELLPFLNRVDDSHRKVYELIGPTFSGLDSLAQAFDKNGHDVAFQPGAGTRFLDGFLPCTTLLTDPTSADKIACQNVMDILNPVLNSPTSSARVQSAPADGGLAADASDGSAPVPDPAANQGHAERGTPLSGYWDNVGKALASGGKR